MNERECGGIIVVREVSDCECEERNLYSLGALVKGPDGGVEGFDSFADVVGEGGDLLSEDDPGEG